MASIGATPDAAPFDQGCFCGAYLLERVPLRTESLSSGSHPTGRLNPVVQRGDFYVFRLWRLHHTMSDETRTEIPADTATRRAGGPDTSSAANPTAAGAASERVWRGRRCREKRMPPTARTAPTATPTNSGMIASCQANSSLLSAATIPTTPTVRAAATPIRTPVPGGACSGSLFTELVNRLVPQSISVVEKQPLVESHMSEQP